MKIFSFTPSQTYTWQGMLSILLVAVHGWVNFLAGKANESKPFLVPSAGMAFVLAIAATIAFCYFLQKTYRKYELSKLVSVLSLAYLLFISYGIWAKGYDVLLAVYFWVYLNISATIHSNPKNALFLAGLSWMGYTVAHFFADESLMPCAWWFGPLMGLLLLLTSFMVLYRGFEVRKEMRAQRDGWAAARKQLENNELRLLNYSKRLEESNENLQEFAYVISHDLREPLRTISAYTQLLKRRLEPEKQTQEIQDFMHFIIDAAQRMDSQINGILEYSRVGRDELNLENFSISEAVELAKSNLQAKIFTSAAVIDFVGGEAPHLHADKMQVSILLQNLIGNAIKYRKPNSTPHIRIAWEQMGNFLKFSITDNGIGIETPYLESIFGVFRRLHTRNDIEGSGIGLSICRRIVQRHGGKIWATSTFGEGSTFHFTLPAASD